MKDAFWLLYSFEERTVKCQHPKIISESEEDENDDEDNDEDDTNELADNNDDDDDTNEVIDNGDVDAVGSADEKDEAVDDGATKDPMAEPAKGRKRKRLTHRASSTRKKRLKNGYDPNHSSSNRRPFELWTGKVQE